MLVGLSEQIRPVGLVFVRITLPVKPSIPATVIVELASLFANTVELVGFALMVKSTTVTGIISELETVPDVPVTVSCALPATCPTDTVRIVLAFPPVLRVTEGGLKPVTNPHAHPLAVALKVTEPLKLPKLVIVMLVFTEPPAGIVSTGGLADRENPSTCTVTVA